MAIVKISALPPAGGSSLTDILPMVQPPVGGTTFKVSLQQILTLFNLNIQIAESQVTNLTTDLADKVTRSGDTMTGFLILNADPVAALGAATKQYVDNAIQGLNLIPAVYAASAASYPSVTYSNGASGVGATLTNTGGLVSFSIDSVSPPLNSRILVKDQASQLQNGIYTLTTQGSVGVPWVLTRATDYDQPSEINPGDVVLVNFGTVNGGTGWIERSTVTTIGVDAITFSQFGGIVLPLSLAQGGTGAALTASNGGIFYSTATTGAILAGTGTANQLLRSGSNSAPAWTTATYPLTTSINQLLYSSSANVITGLASAASSVLTTNGSSIPAFSTTLPAGLTIPGYALSGANSDITSLTGLTGKIQAPTAIASSTGANVLGFSYAASAVNYIQIGNAVTAGIPSINAVGSDSTVNLFLTAKGGGFFLQDSSGVVGTNLLWFNAAGTQYTNLKVAPAQATTVTFTLPAADGTSNQALVTNGSGVLSFASFPTGIVPKVTVYTSGSGTHTNTGSPSYITVEMVGGGAGGQASSSNGGVSTAATSGGNTTFGSSLLTANGGTANGAANYIAGVGGTASGGDINVTGGGGGGGSQNATTGTGSTITQLTGAMGGSSYYGGAGASGSIGAGAGGAAAANSGSGGGGGGINLSLGYVTGAGGGAGGYCRKLIASPSASYSYAVGAAGSGGIGGISNGGAGSAGRIIVTEYYG